MNKYICIVFTLIIMGICGCSDKKTQDSTTSLQETDGTTTNRVIIENETTTDIRGNEEYLKIDSFDDYSKLRYEAISVNLPKAASLTSYSVYKNKIYYAVDFQYQLNMNVVKEEGDYISRIIEYDTTSKEYNTVYRATDGNTSFLKLSCNGSYLVWLQNKNIYVMNLVTKNIEKIYINVYNLVNDFEITDKYLFYIGMAEGIRCVYRYDLESKRTECIIKDILGNTMKAISYYDNRLTTYIFNKDMYYVYVYDINGNKLFEFESNKSIETAKCNDDMCIWVTNNTLGRDLHIYDLNKGKTYLMQNISGDVTLCDKYVVTSKGTMVCSYEPGDKSEKVVKTPCEYKQDEDYISMKSELDGVISMVGATGAPSIYDKEQIIAIYIIPID